MVSISEAIASAFQAYQAGNLFEAEWICQDIVQQNLVQQNSMQQNSVQQNSVQQNPALISALHLLGAIAYQTSRLESAITHYQAVIGLDPQQFEAHSNLAVALQDRGDWQLAETHFMRALELNPAHAPAHFNLGNLRLLQGDVEAAISHYRRAIAIKPNHARAYNNLGNALKQQGDRVGAIAHYQQAIALEPTDAQAYINLGNVLQEQEQHAAAVAQYQQALALQPRLAGVYFNLGLALGRLEQFEAAVDSYRQALALDPNQANVHNSLALALQEQNQMRDAIAHWQQAIALQPDYPEALNNLGAALYEQNDLEGAIDYCQRAIALNPSYAQAHLNLSLALLATGDFQRGFAEYEWRWHCRDIQPEARRWVQGDRRWDGSSLQERTLLLLAEQGLGDAIQFIRYVPLLAAQGVRVIVECPPELLHLFAPLPGISQLIPSGSALPEHDAYLPLLSLPHILGTTLDTIPNQIPYLNPEISPSPLPSPPPSLSPTFPLPHLPPSPRVSSSPLPPSPHPSLKIGITWAASPRLSHAQPRSYRNRTAPLSAFMALQSVPNVALYSLQIGSHASDIGQYGYQETVQDLSHLIHDFSDTARLIAQLDLVISVDTAVAHLAGAMGKPVWVVLPFAADWRWLRHRQDSPWYPTMRLFRQKAWGDWAGAMEQVVKALVR